MNVYHVLLVVSSQMQVFRIEATNGHGLHLKVREFASVILENPQDTPLKDRFGLYQKTEPLKTNEEVILWIEDRMSDGT